jgi:hypothetical protein
LAQSSCQFQQKMKSRAGGAVLKITHPLSQDNGGEGRN